MTRTRIGLVGLIGGLLITSLPVTEAASSLSLSLTGFSGDSNQVATQMAVGAAGLNFFSTAGPQFSTNNNGSPDDPSDDFQELSNDDTVVFDANGAHLGSRFAGDGGRNYVRTNESDYATTAFVAEITFDAGDGQAVYFGLGSGDRALFGTPDWSTQLSSASFWPETNNDKFTRFRTQNDVNAFADTGVPGFSAGTHRMRMTFNPVASQLFAQIDTNYAGGPFVADATTTNFPISTATLFAADGWPTEPSRIFFGGDDGAVFRDLSIRVVPEPASVALAAMGVAMAVVAVRRRRS